MAHLSTMVEIAAALRSRAGQTKAPYSTAKIIESCFPQVLVTGYRLPPGVDELVQSCSNGATILYSRSLPMVQQRFAIAHALAHLIFDDRADCMRPGYAGNPRAEVRADWFGAELLAPKAELHALVERLPSEDHEEHELYLDQCDRMASHFKMPPSVIDLQIQRLGLTHKSVDQIRLTNW